MNRLVLSIAGLLVASLLFVPGGPAEALTLNPSLCHDVSGCPGGSFPWLTVVIEDTGDNQVQLTATASLEVATEFITKFYLNLDPDLDRADLTFSDLTLNGIDSVTFNVTCNAGGCAADGDGRFDIIFELPTSDSSDRMDGTDSFSVLIDCLTCETGTFDAGSFNFFSDPQGGQTFSGQPGPFRIAAHIQGLTGGGSTWIAGKGGSVPEPTTLALLGVGLLGAMVLGRRFHS